MSLCCKRSINHTNFIHMKFICILVGTLVLSNLNPDSPPLPLPLLTWQCIALAGKYRDAFAGEDQSGWCSVLLAAFAGFVFLFLAVSVSVSLSWFCTSLQSIRFQILRSIYTCSCASKLRREQGNFYKMCRRCWNRGVIFLVLLLTHLQYGMKWWLL